MKKTLILLIITFLLFSCGEDEKNGIENKKENFIVKTKDISSFSGNYEIKKTGKIAPSQEIILTSKASARIKSIFKKSGEKIITWTKIISMSDTVANYWLNLEKTNLGLESSKLNYSSTKISLDKQVSDLTIALEKIKKEYEITKKTLKETEKSSNLNLVKIVKEYNLTKENLEENKKIASISLENSSILNDEKINSSKLQIRKLKENISKAELDYKNLLLSNSEQIKSFETTVKKDYLNLANLFTDIIDFSDKILGVTRLNREENDNFQDYLGAKNRKFKKNLETELFNLIQFKNIKFDRLEINNIKINNLEKIFLYWSEGYEKTINFLNNFERIFDYSIENVYFSKVLIDSYKLKINWFQAQLQWNYASFLWFKASTNNFLNTYKSREKSLKKQIEIFKIDLELLEKNLWVQNENAKINYKKSLILEKNTLNSLENSIKTFDINHKKTLLNSENVLNNMEVSLKNAKLNLSNAKLNRDITLKQLNNSIKISQNTKSLAYKEYSKLFILSPISGVLSEVLVDMGEDVNIGTPLVKLASIWKNEVEIWLNFSETKFIKVWNKVKINYMWEKLEWNISSISPIADQNLNYKAKVSINSKVNISGNIVEVLIPVNLDKRLIWLQNLKVKSDKIGEINTFKNNKIEKVLVNFWNFFGENVEIIWCVDLEKKDCDNLEIITSDISKFDIEKFNIIKK